MQFGYTVAPKHFAKNLLINPRGKINQAGDAQGVIPANTYFCDGWKSGVAGAEVYVDDDGFRLVSGTIKQLVPNNLEEDRPLRANFDVVNGNPQLSINGGSSIASNNAAAYIELEISGNNSKFTRVILAEVVSSPIYQQAADELTACLKFYQHIVIPRVRNKSHDASGIYCGTRFPRMISTPAATLFNQLGTAITLVSGQIGPDVISIGYKAGTEGTFDSTVSAKLDARP